jgi:hypothetical protein
MEFEVRDWPWDSPSRVLLSGLQCIRDDEAGVPILGLL